MNTGSTQQQQQQLPRSEQLFDTAYFQQLVKLGIPDLAHEVTRPPSTMLPEPTLDTMKAAATAAMAAAVSAGNPLSSCFNAAAAAAVAAALQQQQQQQFLQ